MSVTMISLVLQLKAVFSIDSFANVCLYLSFSLLNIRTQWNIYWNVRPRKAVYSHIWDAGVIKYLVFCMKN